MCDKRNDLTITLNPSQKRAMWVLRLPLIGLVLALSLYALGYGVACAAPSSPLAPPGEACLDAAHHTTRRAGLPKGMLRAIGMVETGHVDQATGTMTPWPYSVDVDGTGRWFNRASSAIAYVHDAIAGGAHYIDVGCFQIDLAAHPNAFASLEAAFNPADNARYAAHFLNLLHGEFGTWSAAIAAYHAGTPALGVPYAQRVLAAWGRGGTYHGPITPRRRAAKLSDPYVIHIGPNSSGGLPKIVTP